MRRDRPTHVVGRWPCGCGVDTIVVPPEGPPRCVECGTDRTAAMPVVDDTDAITAELNELRPEDFSDEG